MEISELIKVDVKHVGPKVLQWVLGGQMRNGGC